VSGWLRGWRVSLRVARREARRARGRSILVLAMIALPVAALAFAAVYHDTFTLTPAERAGRLMGRAQAVVIWPEAGPVRQDPDSLDSFFTTVAAPRDGARAAVPGAERLLKLLPPRSRVIADQMGRLRVRTAAGIGTLPVRGLDLADPLAEGIMRRLSGRMPTRADEVALTPAAARRIGGGVGGSVRPADGSHGFRVVGLVEDPTDLEATTVVMRGVLPPAALSDDPRELRWLAATPGPLTWEQVKRLNTHGVVAVSRDVLAHPPSRAQRYLESPGGKGSALGVPALVGGLALLEVVLLAGPAFAVGARRRRRDLALVAAAGGTPAQLRRVVLADGVVLGAAAAAGGVVLAIAAAAAARPLLEQHLTHARSGDFRVFPLALGSLAVLALATGVLAALAPAWIAGRQDVVTALAGRRGITRSHRLLPVLGAMLAAAGAGVSAMGAGRGEGTIILAGLAAGELGLVLCTPAIVGLVARLGRWLPLAPRIALRDTSRNRAAAAPAISAVMAAVVGSLAVGVVLTSSADRARDEYRSLDRPGDVVLDRTGKLAEDGQQPVPAQAIATLRRMMPVERVHRIGLPCGPGQCFVTPRVPVARNCPYSPEVLRRDPTPAEQQAARRDARCDGVGGLYRYFEHLFTDSFTLVVDPDAVGAVTGLEARDAAAAGAALRAGKVVVGHPRYLHDGQVTLTITALDDSHGVKREASRMVTAPGFALPRPPRAPVMLMTGQTARSLGMGSVASMVLATTSRMPTVAEEDRLQAAVRNGVGVYVERGPRARSDTRSLLLLAIVAGVVALGAAAIATGLAAADGRAELGTLAAVGASPRVRRALSLSQSGVIAGLGSLLGAVAGLGGSVAVLVAFNRGLADVWPAPAPYPIAVPWRNVGIAVLVVPMIAMLGAGLLTRSRLPIERRL
jgi:putative ABC transport system permease protein